MNLYSAKNDIIEILKQLFPDNEIILEKVNYCGSISVFIVSIKESSELEKIWSKVSSAIAAYYQSFLENDFEKWNIYVIYKCEEPINVSLTYKIENDKFSSRKIVHTITGKENLDLINNLIVSNYITNKDLSISNNTRQNSSKYISDSVLWQFISKGKIKPTRNSIKEVEFVLEQIEKTLQDEN